MTFGTMDVQAIARLLSGKKLVVLGGAGISRESGLPIANELTDEILRHLRMSKPSKDVMALARPPFELFIETLAGCSDVSPLYEIYQRAAPCMFHRLCAQLWNDGLLSAVVTTNFDTLFEDALHAKGIDYDRFWQEAELSNWAPTMGRLPLIKLHGSAHDERSLGATIRRVANQRGVRAREAALCTAFRAADVEFILVAGYSGSDKFDLNPALGRLAFTAPPVALIAHRSGKGISAVVEPLSGHVKAGPFAAFQGVRIECETSALLLEMMSPDSTIKNSFPPDHEWHEQVSMWFTRALKKHKEAFRAYMCGALLRAAARPRHALRWFKKALNLPASSWLKIEILLSLARCERDVGESVEGAQRAAGKALRLARKHNLPDHEIRALIELGVIAADLRRYTHALRYYKQAENHARITGESEKIGICLGNAGIVRKNMGGRRRWLRALRDYDAAIEIARQTGDKRSEGRTIGNLGILHSVMGNPPLAITHFREAAGIARDLGDLYHEAIWLVCEADDTFTNDPAKAIDLVQLARKMFLPLSKARVKECDDHLRRFHRTSHP